MFVKIPYSADREVSPWAETSTVPTSKLLSDNPSLAYDIKVGEATVLVCDWYGNEYFRTDTKIKTDKLTTMIGKVADMVEDSNKSLQKTLDKAVASREKANTKDALKKLMDNFETGLTGLEAQEASIRVFHEIMDELREKKDALVEANDAAGLKELAKLVKKTELEKEVSDAIAAVGLNAKAEN
jgi:hypothetical protein